MELVLRQEQVHLLLFFELMDGALPLTSGQFVSVKKGRPLCSIGLSAFSLVAVFKML